MSGFSFIYFSLSFSPFSFFNIQTERDPIRTPAHVLFFCCCFYHDVVSSVALSVPLFERKSSTSGNDDGRFM